MDAWGSLLALAASQHNVVAVHQLDALGLDGSASRRRATREGWTQPAKTLWVPPGAELDSWGLASAASLACGDHAMVTGLAGLWLHGVDVAFPGTLRVVTPMNRHAVRSLDSSQIQVIASRTIEPGDATVRRRVPAAKVDRCFLDLVIPPTPSVTFVRDLLITAFQARQATHAGVLARAERARGLPGRGVLLRALGDLTQGGADSPLTDRVLRQMLRDGFRPDPHPVPVSTPGRVLHPDITFSDRCVCIECDGLRFHGRQKDVAVDDRKNRRYREAGWTCLRIGWWELTHGWAGFAADLRTALNT